MSARIVRWGIVGPGRIADRVMPDFAFLPGAEVVAVASRSQERADAISRRAAERCSVSASTSSPSR